LPVEDECCGAAEHFADGDIPCESAVPRDFAITSRSAGFKLSPMVFIFPVSNAARIACHGICLSVSRSGAPTELPVLWQFAHPDRNNVSGSCALAADMELRITKRKRTVLTVIIDARIIQDFRLLLSFGNFISLSLQPIFFGLAARVAPLRPKCLLLS
jgi:hypothetical protein